MKIRRERRKETKLEMKQKVRRMGQKNEEEDGCLYKEQKERKKSKEVKKILIIDNRIQGLCIHLPEGAST